MSLTEESPTRDPAQFWLNMLSIGLSFTFSIGTGWWIYRLTLEQMRKMDREGGGHDGEYAAEALEEGALLDAYTDDDVEENLTGRPESRHELRPNKGVLRRTSSSGSSG